MRTLYLPLKKQWYEMIERGEKREEYREFSPHWIARLMEWSCYDTWEGLITNRIREYEAIKIFNDYGNSSINWIANISTLCAFLTATLNAG